MSGGRNNKARGYALEREAVLAAEAAGLEAKRVFASGAFKEQLGEDFAGDVVIEGLRCEMKRRKSGFKLLYDAFDQDDADVVVVRADRSPRLYLLREETFHNLLKRAKERENESI
tara:strand:- start:404 stop:748 length:345 start_codon:yes stop_codon:yes gene_type:complete